MEFGGNRALIQHLQRMGRYVIAIAAGLLFAYFAWTPSTPPGENRTVVQPIELPDSMIEAVRERGLLPPGAKTIPPPEAVVNGEGRPVREVTALRSEE